MARDVPRVLEDLLHAEAISTTVFKETRGITTVVITILYASGDARDMARRSGMEHGMAAGYDRLEALLPTIGEHR